MTMGRGSRLPTVMAVVLLLASAALGAEEEKVLLRYKFPKGAILCSEGVIVVNLRAPEVEDLLTTALIAVKVTPQKRDGESTRVEMKLDRMKIWTADSGFDSTNKEDREQMIKLDPTFQGKFLLVDVPFGVSVTDSGEVTSYDLTQLKKRLTESGNPNELDAIKAPLEQLIEGNFAPMPERAVGKGDTWMVKLGETIAGIGRIDVDYTFQLDGFEKIADETCARILVTGRGKFSADADVKQNAKMEKYHEQGVLLFSVDRGRVITSKVNAAVTFIQDNRNIQIDTHCLIREVAPTMEK